MKLWYNIMLFTIVVNLAAYLIQIFNILPFSQGLAFDPTGITNLFTLDYFINSFTYASIGAVAIGLAAMLLRQGTNAIYAMAIWAIGVFIPIIQQFLLAIPNMISAVYPAEMNPLYPLPNPFSLIFGGLFAFAAFMFLMERVTGNPLT